MQSFKAKAAELLSLRLETTNTPIDKELFYTIIKHFDFVHQNYKEVVFEPRGDQLLFAYLLAYQALNDTHTPLALSLGCGEGKQEGFGVAMRVVYELYEKRYDKKPKLLFLTATTNLVTQMQNSTPFKDFKEVYTINKELTSSQAKQSGIYFCDFTTYLYLALRKKEGYSYALFENLYKVFTDEIHAFLNSLPYRISTHIIDAKKLSKSQTKELKELFASYRELTRTIEELYTKEPRLIAQSDTRNQASFNPYKLKKDDTLIEELLYTPKLLKKLYLKNKDNFFALLDTIADAITKTAGKDYYIHTDTQGLLTGYSCADSISGKPMPHTVYDDKLLATLISLKHTKDFLKYQVEFEFVADTYLPTKSMQINPSESIELIGKEKFLTASATIGGISSQLDALGFQTRFLQPELQLSTQDTRVSLQVTQKDPIETFTDSINTLTPQVLVTTKDASLLQAIAEDTRVQEIFKEYEFCIIRHNTTNPDTQSFEKQLQEVKESIYSDPLTKRLLLIQGIAEGSNIFKTTPKAAYEATVFKLDISSIDSVTQTRYRVGVKGRVKGYFTHAVSTDIQTAGALCLDEVAELENAKDKASVLMQIQKRILQENDNKAVVYLHRRKSINRRDFLNKALKLTAASIAVSPAVEFLNRLLGTTLADSMSLYARDNIQYPPGIANCRDPAIKDAYYYFERYGNYRANRYYTGFQMAQTILRDRRIGDMYYMTARSIKDDTPFIEPAYWFMCAKTDIYPDRSIYPKLEKDNPALYYFKKGINFYFLKWIENKRGYNFKKKIETNFLKSIFFAANYTETEVETGVKRYLSIKEDYSKELKEIFNKYKPNWDKMDKEMRYFLKNTSKRGKIMNELMNRLIHEKDYNKRLVAQWSSCFLTNHYAILKNTNKYNLINKFIEKPLRAKDPRVRGPPYY